MPTNDERRRSPMVEPSAEKRRADIKPSDNRRQTAKEPFPQTARGKPPGEKNSSRTGPLINKEMDF